MPAVAEANAPVSPLLVAGLLLAARDHLRALDLPCPTVAQVLATTGASRSRAYELREDVLAVLPSLQRPVGRPSAPPREINADIGYELRGAVIVFLRDHPGCVFGGSERHRYADAFRLFVLDLRDHHRDVDLEHFADALQLPLGTLKDWLATGAEGDGTAKDDGSAKDEGDEGGRAPASALVQLVLSCWKTWAGSFGDFCDHLRQHQRVPFGRSLISDILFLHGLRRPRRRRGRSPDERALRGAFETFFGGAQWVGDGWAVPVSINGARFDFNVELMVDPYSDAFVGLSIRDHEDSAAVTEALADGLAATGEVPLALLLDNKPSNHSDEVGAALGDLTQLLHATPFRPQNKAHCEGGFGLFHSSIPPLDLHANNLHDLARSILGLVVQTCARTLNHRPRYDRGGRSRVQLYNEPVSAEQIDNARAALEERRKKQARARATLLARQDPTARTLLDDTFTRLAFLDPDGHLRAAIARYPLDVIVDAIAIFDGKRRVGTLPKDVDARYLLGIVNNLANQREGIAIAEQLLRARLDARDRMLAPLVQARDAARVDTTDLPQRLLLFADRALADDRHVDRLFWLLTVADEINSHANGDTAPLLTAVARRIHATHRVPYRERQQAVIVIFDRVIPLN